MIGHVLSFFLLTPFTSLPFLTLPMMQMAEWDLTSTMAQYLDRHLIFPLMGHLESQTQVCTAFHSLIPLPLCTIQNKYAALAK